MLYWAIYISRPFQEMFSGHIYNVYFCPVCIFMCCISISVFRCSLSCSPRTKCSHAFVELCFHLLKLSPPYHDLGNTRQSPCIGTSALLSCSELASALQILHETFCVDSISWLTVPSFSSDLYSSSCFHQIRASISSKSLPWNFFLFEVFSADFLFLFLDSEKHHSLSRIQSGP